MSLYSTFETDINLETNGVWLDYEEFRILIAAAGQGNKRYVSYAEKMLKPVRRAMDAGTLSNSRSMNIMADIYAKTIILAWETKVDEKMKSGIEGKDGKLLPFSTENIMLTLKALPRLFTDLQEQAGSLAIFRKEEMELDTKNS